jgi:WD40 repeat protein
MRRSFPRDSDWFTNEVPRGVTLVSTLSGTFAPVTDARWSPDGRYLAVGYADGYIRIWDPDAGIVIRESGSHTFPLEGFAWSPNSDRVACISRDSIQTRGVLDRRTALLKPRPPLVGASWHREETRLTTVSPEGAIWFYDPISGSLLGRSAASLASVAASAFVDAQWSPKGHVLAVVSSNGLYQWSPDHDEWTHLLARPLRRIAWSPDGSFMACASEDRTISIWDATVAAESIVLEGHTSDVSHVAFSADGCLLATASELDVRLWDTARWELLATIIADGNGIAAFHPSAFRLASVGPEHTIRIWALAPSTLLAAVDTNSLVYTNAKVVLVGDTGVGKSGLALALTRKAFVATDSTHARRVWTFSSSDNEGLDGRRELREVLLWDLAGQPGYRLVHQLHLGETSVALVVFDSRSETDPFAGAKHWDRALRQAKRVDPHAIPLVKFLIAARADRGGMGVSRSRLDQFMGDHGFTSYFETSAKEGWGIDALIEGIQSSIPWTSLPRVRSTELFQEIKTFLMAQKRDGTVLGTVKDLYHSFKASRQESTPTDTWDEFRTCVRLVESRGLIRRLSFGDLVLLQPELLDSYGSALVNAAKMQPDETGSLAEEEVFEAQLRLPSAERVSDTVQERLLLIATVEDFIAREIALREQVSGTPVLVFPSEFVRDYPDLPTPERGEVVFRFSGAILNIYTTLAVRLTRSGIFEKIQMWKNAAAFRVGASGHCVMHYKEIEGGKGEIILFYESDVSVDTRLNFEEYVHTHITRLAIPGSIEKDHLYRCDECDTPVLPLAATRRRERGFDWIQCNVCQERVDLLDFRARATKKAIAALPDIIATIDVTANAQRDTDTADARLRGKVATRDFDVFLCHNSSDKAAVRKVAGQLKERGILPWFDEWEIAPGDRWTKVLSSELGRIKAAAVFLGENGVGPWQEAEVEALLIEMVNRKCRIIPVLLPNARRRSDDSIPLFLKGLAWVELEKRHKQGRPIDKLIWGITGQRP